MKNKIKVCPICSIEFTVFISQDRYVTCSYKCRGILRKQSKPKNTCLHCKNEFVVKRKTQAFCSRICNAQSRSNKVDRLCLSCNKSFYIAPSRLSRPNRSGAGTYCTHSCRLEHWNIQSHTKQMPGSYRKRALDIFDKRCYDCNITDERLLVIHHIDGNRKNGLITNLVPVCHNCHCLRHIALSGNNRLPSYNYHGKD